jgi:hypothetical protein
MAVATFVLTVSESKRLIARSIPHVPCIKRAREKGIIAVCKGTTNAYVLEELLGHTVEKTGYVLGATIPAKGAPRASLLPASIPEVVLRDGEVAEGMTVQDAIKEMGPGDVVIKGANALDPDRGAAGVLVQHPEGGTMGALMGRVHGKKVNLVVPVGLEKQVAADLGTVEAKLLSSSPGVHTGPSLWVMHGQIVTEIEALAMLTGAQAMQVAAGGIGGAEGAVWLMVQGSDEQVGNAVGLIEALQGEPPFAVPRS